ncbi:alpha/beta fold hydrolase [Rhodococcus aetherivorans]
MTTIYTSEAGAREVRRRYRDALRDWPIPAEHVRVPTRQGETFVLVSGPDDAPPVLLLHGSGANATMWRDDIGSWARHFRTYAVDLVGEPGRARRPGRPWPPTRTRCGSMTCSKVWGSRALRSSACPSAAGWRWTTPPGARNG